MDSVNFDFVEIDVVAGKGFSIPSSSPSWYGKYDVRVVKEGERYFTLVRTPTLLWAPPLSEETISLDSRVSLLNDDDDDEWGSGWSDDEVEDVMPSDSLKPVDLEIATRDREWYQKQGELISGKYELDWKRAYQERNPFTGSLVIDRTTGDRLGRIGIERSGQQVVVEECFSGRIYEGIDGNSGSEDFLKRKFQDQYRELLLGSMFQVGVLAESESFQGGNLCMAPFTEEDHKKLSWKMEVLGGLFGEADVSGDSQKVYMIGIERLLSKVEENISSKNMIRAYYNS